MEETSNGNQNQTTNNIDDDMSENEDWHGDFDVEIVLENQNILQRLKHNDPAITHLYIDLNCHYHGQDGECFFNSIDWKVDGGCITNNTHLKKLLMRYIGTPLGRDDSQNYILGEQGNKLPTKQQLQDFFSCIYRNRSITQLEIGDITYNSMSITDEFGGSLFEGLRGHPSIKRLDITNTKIGDILVSVLGGLLKHPRSQLKILRLRYSSLYDGGLKLLSNALLLNNTLKSLCLTGSSDITSAGWRALSTVLQHNCNLTELELCHTGINNETANILGRAIRNSSLKRLDLAYNKSINIVGCQTLLEQLSQISLVHLGLRENRINNESLSVLANISTLNSLDLSGITSITPTGWQSLFNSLQTSNTKLKKLSISGNEIGNRGSEALSNLLRSTGTLKELDMSGMAPSAGPNVTSQGWRTLFSLLQDSNLDISTLYLDSNRIDNEGMQLLVGILSGMRSLRYLNLRSNLLVTPNGWQSFAQLLQSPNCTLERLELTDNNVNDDTVVSFSNALAHNKILRRLICDDCYDEDNNELIIERGYEAVSALVCNETSIMDTYNSNHTFQYFYCEYSSDFPHDLNDYLELNQNEDKAEVARQKILQTHFSDASNIQELLDMELEVMPTAIAWVGKSARVCWSGTSVSGLSLLYNLMRRLPDLFDSGAARKKRKRV